MYHIKDDKRAQRSAQLIGEGLLELLRTKKFDQITVTELQRASGVGRATFYRLFDNTADVLAYLCDGVTQRILERQRALAGRPARETVVFFLNEWIQNETLLQAVFDSRHVGALYNAMRTLAEQGGPYFFPGERMEPAQLEYLVDIASTALIGGLSAWVRRGKTETAEDVYARVEAAADAFFRLLHEA